MTANVVVTIAPLLLYKNCISFPFKVQGRSEERRVGKEC